MTTEQQTSANATESLQKPHRKAAPRRKDTPAAKKSAARAKPATTTHRAGGASKQDRLLALLQRPSGATIALCMKASGWQAHSVRGFFAGTVRKKLKLNLVSDVIDGHRVYRIAAARRKPKG